MTLLLLPPSLPPSLPPLPPSLPPSLWTLVSDPPPNKVKPSCLKGTCIHLSIKTKHLVGSLAIDFDLHTETICKHFIGRSLNTSLTVYTIPIGHAASLERTKYH